MTTEFPTPETDPIASRLDALGEADRAAPDAGFERRVARAALAALEQDAPAPIAIRTRRVGFRPAPALAAAALLAVVSGAIWFSVQTQPATPTEASGAVRLAALERDVDEFLALSDMLDEHAGLWGDELRADADQLGDSIGQTWDALETIADDYVEESI